MNLAKFSYIDAKRLKIALARLMPYAQGGSGLNGAVELRKSMTKTIIETGEHCFLHRGHSCIRTLHMGIGSEFR